LPPEQRAAIEAAYAMPARAYHNLHHVGEVLRHYADVLQGPGWTHPDEVAFAVLYHDAIYVAGAKDNETRSAALARAHLAQWWPTLDGGRVTDLIEQNARHGTLSPGDVADEETRLFLDCDMAILAAPEEVFAAYDRGVAEEYKGVVPGFLYRAGRRRFLQGLLRAPRIFLSDFFDQQLDAAARANLRRQLGA